MAPRQSSRRNEYRCTLELNQNGKYCLRIRASFGRHGWVLPVYALAGSFDRAMKKLREAVEFLQVNEEKLWFWGVDRSDDIRITSDMLHEAGLRLDRRAEFPRKAALIHVLPDHPVPAFLLAPARRTLTDAVSGIRLEAASD